MRIFLAPMEGLLDYMLRDTLTQPAADMAMGVCGNGPHPSGIDFCVAEFIRVTNTLLPERSFFRVVPELKTGGRTLAGVPVRVQLLGSDPVCMAENAARAAALGAPGIDINFGCPTKLVNRHGGGAILLKEPEVMRAIVAAVRAAVPDQIPVTAKMRLGYDTPSHALVCAEALAAGGASEIAVHARTKMDGYKPPAYWEWIARIREQIPLPIIANGEIWDVADARRCQVISNCQDIMIGRGAVANPALARLIRGQLDATLSWSEVLGMLHHFWIILESRVTARNRGGRIKQWLLYLSRNYVEARTLFEIIRRVSEPEDIAQILFSTGLTTKIAV